MGAETQTLPRNDLAHYNLPLYRASGANTP
jgi:hypothetical protein